MATVLALAALAGGVALVVVGAEVFAEHLEAASRRLGVSAFALALLLAGAEPEELATTVAASLRKAPAIAFGDVIGANVAMCLVALPVGALVAPLPFGPRVRRYALLALPLGVVASPTNVRLKLVCVDSIPEIDRIASTRTIEPIASAATPASTSPSSRPTRRGR
ncbi:MAG: hypothetical protein ACJ73V_00420, partial [Acidimicrobiia bacterium]